MCYLKPLRTSRSVYSLHYLGGRCNVLLLTLLFGLVSSHCTCTSAATQCYYSTREKEPFLFTYGCILPVQYHPCDECSLCVVDHPTRIKCYNWWVSKPGLSEEGLRSLFMAMVRCSSRFTWYCIYSGSGFWTGTLKVWYVLQWYSRVTILSHVWTLLSFRRS